MAESIFVRWHLYPYPELRLDDLYDILELRQRVFVVEQNCPYIDADGVDLSSWHVVGRDEHAALVAYARIIPPGVKYTELTVAGSYMPTNNIELRAEVRGDRADEAVFIDSDGSTGKSLQSFALQGIYKF